MRNFEAIVSTIHGMIRFRTINGFEMIHNKPPTGPIAIMVENETSMKMSKKMQENNGLEEIIINSRYADQVVWIAVGLPYKLKDELTTLLKENVDIFMWDATIITGVPKQLVEHKINERPGSKPIQQKKRGQSKDIYKAINDEADKLVKAGIVQELLFPSWVANPVLVKKGDGKWRMCIDFTNPNKACPKDCYSLPSINEKIESLHGHKWKSFLDAYKGYHKIHMHNGDEEKRPFHTDRGAFCYIKIPFGQRNV